MKILVYGEEVEVSDSLPEIPCEVCGTHQTLRRDSKYVEDVNLFEEGKAYNLVCKNCRAIKEKKETDEVKAILIAENGGCCNKCGLRESIVRVAEFHHIWYGKDCQHHHLKKNFDISGKPLVGLYNSGKDRLYSELAKTILLCSNCHSELHYYEDSTSDETAQELLELKRTVNIRFNSNTKYWYKISTGWRRFTSFLSQSLSYGPYGSRH